jgi:hypothetical protein
MRELTRRDALSGAAALGAVGLTGCVSGDSEENDTGSENSTEGNTTEDTLSLSGTSIETTESGCASGGGGTAAVAVENGAVVVDGTLGAPTPCHEAVLDSAEQTDGTLSLVVGLTDTSGETACVSCTGAVTYEAVAEFSGEIRDVSEVGGVRVDHAGGATYTLEGGQLRPVDGSSRGGTTSPPSTGGVASRSIETGEATCGGADSHEVTRGDGRVTVEGTIPASNPCHEAVLESVGLSGGSLSVVVGVQSTRDEGEVCANCIGEVTYRAEVTLEAGTSVDSVGVRHDSPIDGPVRERQTAES